MCFHRRRGGFGNSGSIRAHKASSIKRWDMRDRLPVGHATVPIQPEEYKTSSFLAVVWDPLLPYADQEDTGKDLLHCQCFFRDAPVAQRIEHPTETHYGD
jgi:hypothetical protein